MGKINLIDTLTRKEWSENDLSNMLGRTRSTHLAYAGEETIRQEAASGGATSALLIYALENDIIDGAIVCRSVIADGQVRAHFHLAKSREEILAARGSKYVETKFLKEVLPLIRQSEGRIAVCGLPCDISNLKRWENKEPELASRVALRVSFLCGHNSRKELIDGVTRKLKREQSSEKNLVDFKFRTGHWRGNLEAVFDDQTSVKKPFSYFSDYRNLSFYSERKCLACIDHFGFDADISFGDVWLYELRDHPVKHSCVVIRSRRAEEIYQRAVEDEFINSENITSTMILDGQSRIAPTHYDISARAKAAKLLGMKVPDKLNQSTSWIKTISAFLGLVNMQLSESRYARFILRAPRPLIRGYLYFKKGLETLA